MARYRRGRMALYEVMSKARQKPGYGRTLDKIRTDVPEKDSDVVKDAGVVEKEEVGIAGAVAGVETAASDDGDRIEQAVTSTPVKWRRKPRPVQYNGGRIEFSVPYQLAIAVALGLIVVVLLAFQAGQRSVAAGVAEKSIPEPKAGGNIVNRSRPRPVVPPVDNRTVAEPSTSDGTTVADAAATAGDNVIVLVQHKTERDLVPVRAHFANNGIATDIVPSGGTYFLVTQDRYKSFGRGGDGSLALQRIKEVGAAYKGKAPEGYETFAPHYFSDAYGKKIE
ncbi:MAG: hypothetical protein JW720_12705 [Sedimentisphaerales bacterium]|nr:hypothetical protein [Sedimentisphaerales bacterium]